MPEVRPFKAIRPVRDKAYLVATRSYLSYSEEVLRDKLHNNPYTFLQIIHPDLPNETQSFGIERYEKVRKRFDEFYDMGIFLKEDQPCFYIYRQVTASNTHTGVIAAVSVEDYVNGKIKIHEHTLSAREEMFKDYLSVTRFNAEPVLLSHKPNSEINFWIEQNTLHRAEYEFTSTDKTLHLLWPISEPAAVQNLQSIYFQLSALYIADGHHRTASSALFYEAFPDIKSSGFFMAMIMDESAMRISSFSRLVRHTYRSLNAVLRDLSKNFHIETLETARTRIPKGHFDFYGEGKWHALSPIPNLKLYEDDPVEGLAPSLLARYILQNVFDIYDMRTDERLLCEPDLDQGNSIEKKVNAGLYEYGIRYAPLLADEVRKVADFSGIMPPKSTYIEPKLRSGLLIYPLE